MRTFLTEPPCTQHKLITELIYNSMNVKFRPVALAAIVFFNLSALAQSQEPPKNPSAIESFIWSILPLVIIAAFIWFVFIKGIRKVQEKSLEAHRQHNET